MIALRASKIAELLWTAWVLVPVAYTPAIQDNRLFMCTCATRILAAASIREQRLFRSARPAIVFPSMADCFFKSILCMADLQQPASYWTEYPSVLQFGTHHLCQCCSQIAVLRKFLDLGDIYADTHCTFLRVWEWNMYCCTVSEGVGCRSSWQCRQNVDAPHVAMCMLRRIWCVAFWHPQCCQVLYIQVPVSVVLSNGPRCLCVAIVTYIPIVTTLCYWISLNLHNRHTECSTRT